MDQAGDAGPGPLADVSRGGAFPALELATLAGEAAPAGGADLLLIEPALGAVAAVAAFALSYIALMAAPGPNLLAVAAVASLRGFRGVLPLCAGIAAGAGALAVALALAFSLLGQDPGWGDAARQVAALLLLLLAFRIARTPRPPEMKAPNTPAPSLRDGALAFGTGFVVAASNPTSATFLTAHFLGPAGVSATLPAMLVLVPALALLGNAGLAALFARPAARRLLQRHFRAACLVSAAVLVGLAVTILREAARS
jgi:threonine/homoserine/homoserine lactone efflux protein